MMKNRLFFCFFAKTYLNLFLENKTCILVRLLKKYSDEVKIILRKRDIFGQIVLIKIQYLVEKRMVPLEFEKIGTFLFKIGIFLYEFLVVFEGAHCENTLTLFNFCA